MDRSKNDFPVLLGWMMLASAAVLALEIGARAGAPDLGAGRVLSLVLASLALGASVVILRALSRTKRGTEADHLVSEGYRHATTHSDVPYDARVAPLPTSAFDPRMTRRFEFALYVERNQDLVRIQYLTQRAMTGTDRVLGDPEPFAVVEVIGDFGVTLRVCGWIPSDEDLGRARSESIRAVRRALEAAGVRMPGAPRPLLSDSVARTGPKRGACARSRADDVPRSLPARDADG